MMPFDFKPGHRFRFSPERPFWRRKRWVLPILGTLVAVGVFSVFWRGTAPTISPPERRVEETGSIPPAKEPELFTIEGKVETHGTFLQSLMEKKIGQPWIQLIISQLKPHINFRKIKGGSFRFVGDKEGNLVKFTYEAGPTEIYEIVKGPQGYTASRLDVPLDTRLVKVVGEIRSSLFEAMEGAGEQDSLTLAFAEILAWEVDFYKDLREGDRFKVVVEKLYKGEDFIRYGLVHAVEYKGQEKSVTGIRYREDYYDERGISLKKAFLKAPLRFNRISSRFSRSRRHPILGGLRPHLGTDYAAPIGTPVWAVGDGTVVSFGWNEGYGKQVVLRHMNGYMTYYSHLSHFGPGIQAGRSVKQKQIIGYVGSSGLSTGPHLDYRLARNGQFRNPLRESLPTGVPLEKSELEKYQRQKEEVLMSLQGDAPWQQKQASSKLEGTSVR
jgi:murein DD-endopeptidase MepM/ murein hydrolase activator NlpD